MRGLSTIAPALFAFCSSGGKQSITNKAAHHYYSSTTTALGATKRYLLHYRYVEDVLEKRAPYREEHLALANGMKECLLAGPSGPLAGGSPTGALFVFETEAAAKTYAQQDPYVENGIVTRYHIEEWTVAVEK